MTVGVLMDSAVVAFPIDQEVDFRPVEVEAVIIATLPFGAGTTVKRIPAGSRRRLRCRAWNDRAPQSHCG